MTTKKQRSVLMFQLLQINKFYENALEKRIFSQTPLISKCTEICNSQIIQQEDRAKERKRKRESKLERKKERKRIKAIEQEIDALRKGSVCLTFS